MHGQFLRQKEEIRDDATWDWLRKGDLKKETEGMITAAQDQALRTNAIKAKVEKQNLSPLCRMCGEKDESMGHLVGEFSKLAQTEYKHRHDNVARMIHWNIAHSYGLDVSNKWYEHKPDHVKLLWDFNIQPSEKTRRGCSGQGQKDLQYYRYCRPWRCWNRRKRGES